MRNLGTTGTSSLVHRLKYNTCQDTRHTRDEVVSAQAGFPYLVTTCFLLPSQPSGPPHPSPAKHYPTFSFPLNPTSYPPGLLGPSLRYRSQVRVREHLVFYFSHKLLRMPGWRKAGLSPLELGERRTQREKKNLNKLACP